MIGVMSGVTLTVVHGVANGQVWNATGLKALTDWEDALKNGNMKIVGMVS